jgi:hypothetical protein
VRLGVLALTDPGATLGAIVTVGGMWAVAVGVMRVILSFEIKRLPETVDDAFTEPIHNGAVSGLKPDRWYLVTKDRMIAPTLQRMMAERIGATTSEVSGSDSIYVSQPRVVAGVITHEARSLSAAPVT